MIRALYAFARLFAWLGAASRGPAATLGRYGPNAIAPVPGSVTIGAWAPAFAGTS